MANLDENATVSRVPDKKSDGGKPSDSSEKKEKEDDKKKKDTNEAKDEASREKSADTDKDTYKDTNSEESSSGKEKKDSASENSSSDESDKDDASNDEQKSKSDKKKKRRRNLQKASMTANAAGQAAKLMIQAKILAFMKNMMMLMMQLLQNAIALATAAVQAVIASVVHIITTIAAALAISTIAATIGVIGAVAVVAVAAVVVVSGVVNDQTAQRDSVTVDCKVDYKSYDDLSSLDNEELDAIASKVYSALSVYGLPDVNISGILGNWAIESGIDATSVETIFDEKYTIGSRKQNAMGDWDEFVKDVVFPAYNRKVSINESGYQATDGYCYPGIGLGQWTGERARMLVIWAQNASTEDLERHWYDMDVQLSFMVGGDIRKSWLEAWTTEATPELAAKNFKEGWEGNGNGTLEDRQKQAAYYFMRMGEWEVDADYGQSILELAGTTSVNGDARAAVQNYDKCGVRSYENASIAKAAVSFAWDNKDMARNNDGTSTYKAVCEAVGIAPPGPYQECAAVVAAAVRWSGTDDNYPPHSVDAQEAYLESNTDRWKEITWDGTSEAVLKPGDIFIINTSTDSHTFVYVGEATVNELRDWVGSTMDVVAGSYSATNTNGRSAGLEDHFRVSHGTKVMPSAEYRVFRATGKEFVSRYKNVLDSGH